jgi:hypothetical protein
VNSIEPLAMVQTESSTCTPLNTVLYLPGLNRELLVKQWGQIDKEINMAFIPWVAQPGGTRILLENTNKARKMKANFAGHWHCIESLDLWLTWQW